MKKTVLTLFYICTIFQFVLSQNQDVSGSVKDASSFQPLHGVTIQRGGQQETSSDSLTDEGRRRGYGGDPRLEEAPNNCCTQHHVLSHYTPILSVSLET